MSISLIVFAAAVYLVVAYFTYGRLVSRFLGVDSSRPTPAHEMRDGVDYVPCKAPVLLGHHFASIAGAGPIVGPVLAAAFGWIPALLWILLGAVFMGAVHDFAALMASVRHRGKSIGEVIEANIGLPAKRLFLVFSWSALILVIAVFINVVSKTFVMTPAVATSSLLFIAVAIGFGFSIYRKNVSLVLATMIGVLLLAGCVYVGLLLPCDLTPLSLGWTKLTPQEQTVVTQAGLSKTDLLNPQLKSKLPSLAKQPAQTGLLKAAYEKAQRVSPYRLWSYVLLVYIFVASVTPVWILLQPRDYLNSFLLYGMLAGALVGLMFASPVVVMAAKPALNTKLGPIFPILFVTIACGAISGFHSLVASGTTAKQLNSEGDAQCVSYGAMLIEGLLAVLAVCTVCILAKKDFSALLGEGGPIPVFASGIASFMEGWRLPHETGTTFVALAVSAFALTSLDTGTRLARFAFQEFFESRTAGRSSFLSRNRFVATFITVACAAALVFSGSATAIWPVFGASNQLLAALCLMAVTVWLARRGRSNWFVRIPMWIMFTVTLSALAILINKNLQAHNFVLAGIGFLLFFLAIVLATSLPTGRFESRAEE